MKALYTFQDQKECKSYIMDALLRGIDQHILLVSPTWLFAKYVMQSIIDGCASQYLNMQKEIGKISLEYKGNTCIAASVGDGSKLKEITGYNIVFVLSPAMMPQEILKELLKE